MTPASIIPVFGSQRPYADLNFAGGSFGLDGRSVSNLTALPGFTFTGASLRMGYDATGKLVYGPNNLLLQSQTFQTTWTTTATTVSSDVTTAPDGTLTADKLVESATTAQHLINQAHTNTSDVLLLSVYVKAAGRTQCALQLGGTVKTYFNLSNGTVVSGTGVISDAGNGWYRCSVYGTPTNNNRFVSPAVGGTDNYAGDGTSGIFIWGAQLEAVTYQTTPSTYYPTTTAAYYGPRLVYDPVTLASQGILVEEARTNLLLQSQTFDNASWLKSNITVTANAATAPDGTVTADKAIAATGSVNPLLYQSNTLTAAAYTVSVYAKAAELTWLAIRFDPATTKYSWFDLSNGVVGTVDATHTASIQSVGNGWYRCIVTATGTAASWFSVITPTTANNVSTYTGNSVNGIYVWQAQLELGTGASSPIPTTTAAVTRAADVPVLTGLSVPDGSTLVLEGLVPAFITTDARTGISTNDNSNRTWFVYNGTTLTANVTVAGGSVAVLATAVSANAAFKAAVATSGGAYRAALNGGAVATGSGAASATMTQADIGTGVGGSSRYWNNTISRIRIYNRALPDAQLQSLTT